MSKAGRLCRVESRGRRAWTARAVQSELLTSYREQSATRSHGLQADISARRLFTANLLQQEHVCKKAFGRNGWPVESKVRCSDTRACDFGFCPTSPRDRTRFHPTVPHSELWDVGAGSYVLTDEDPIRAARNQKKTLGDPSEVLLSCLPGASRGQDGGQQT